MTFKEKYTLIGLISEFHWSNTESNNKTLYVFVDDYNLSEFMKFFSDKHRSLFDEDGVECVWRGDYMCFPHFEDTLEYIGLSEEEVHEMFEEE